ncbi:pentatricopeptide repeat-containing protein At4g14050, mitochondrial [Macadamia integrifolia]|uniref:pentatricopeptide repeat-containing protein At4g14050, mitochondrial n=1 Tax=Macadamia integrifolia TaxID=60698 RepID=UPI001C4EF3ED|nr:pentatricopeptide repeat-containing protein At4g14050, mitochondrial [Macadamia integrifolia]
MQCSHFLHQLRACAKSQNLLQGKKFHAQIIKTGLEQWEPLPNNLIDMYGKCAILEAAFHLFDELPQRDHVSWASILTAHNKANLPHRTLSIFRNMFAFDQLQPDNFVFATVVKACGSLGAVKQGKQVHARFVLSQFTDDDVVKSSLVDMYSKCGLLDDARWVFDSISWKNSVCWTAMISGYARNGWTLEAVKLLQRMPMKDLFSWTALISGIVQSGDGFDAIKLFIQMRREGVQIIDPFVLSSVVGASANLAALELGRQIHCLVVVFGYESSVFVSNALVDMYAKCSDILAAKDVFDKIHQRDVVSWTTIIVGAAQHGKAEEALTLFDEMILAGLKPNEVTFVGLIYACSHVGLVDKGRHLFNSMIKEYRINPSLQHYTCLLDLLSRSGHLDEADNLIKTMPFDPDEATWAALLSACKRYGNIEMGIRVSNHLLTLNLQEPSSYILLSSIYASADMWDYVSKVRKSMSVIAVKKEPGYSWVDLGKESQVFYAGETTCHVKEEIFGLLKDLDMEMKKRGYVPDTSFVLQDLEEQEKEQQLFWHSERLAVAYGLLKAVPGMVIRVVKNLRVCGDCHTVLKLICRIVGREIVVRDANRFHHFKDGECSCCDFW